MEYTAIIEKSSEGDFAIRIEEIMGAYGYGATEEEAKADLAETLEEQAEFYKEREGKLPQWYGKHKDLSFRYDLSGFFLAFPCFNVSKFAEAVGINPSLMRKYKEGHAFASDKQKELIQLGLNQLISRLVLARI